MSRRTGNNYSGARWTHARNPNRWKWRVECDCGYVSEPINTIANAEAHGRAHWKSTPHKPEWSVFAFRTDIERSVSIEIPDEEAQR